MLDLVSKVRLGVDLDIIDETKPELLNILLIASQKNYIQNLQQNENNVLISSEKYCKN